MITHSIKHPFCVILALIIGAPAAFSQEPQILPPQLPTKIAAPEPIAPPLAISVIEGNNAVNSISLLRAVTPVVEVRDQNEFPVEGATVVFAMPQQGPGGRFPGDRLSFTTRSDSQGQASAPFIVNNQTGKFQIHVTANIGNRKGEASITQTNSAGVYVGTVLPSHPWYKKWYVWAIFGGAAAGATFGFTRGGGNSPTTIIFTPGGPVFGGPR